MFRGRIKRLVHRVEAHGVSAGVGRMAADAPCLTSDLWSGNLLVCGCARSGATVALNHFAARALDDGARVAMLSLGEEPGPWLRERCDVVVGRAADGGLGNRCEGYLDALRSVRMGTQVDPLLLVLDNYPEAIAGGESGGGRDECGSRIAEETLRIARAEPWTCVAVRAQTPCSALSRELLDQLANRLWTGRSTEVQRMLMFNDPANELAGQLASDIAADLARNRGAALWRPAAGDVRRVDVPWDPVVNGHWRRS